MAILATAAPSGLCSLECFGLSLNSRSESGLGTGSGRDVGEDLRCFQLWCGFLGTECSN